MLQCAQKGFCLHCASYPDPLSKTCHPHPCILLQVYQTVVQQLGPDHPGYIDAVVALAEQHRELGQTAEAER